MKKPPVIKGIDYKILNAPDWCPKCGEIIAVGEYLVTRDRGSVDFSNIIPITNGYCTKCSSQLLVDFLSKRYEDMMKRVADYGLIADKKELSQVDRLQLRHSDLAIKGIERQINELSDFLGYADENEVNYHAQPDDTTEGSDDPDGEECTPTNEQ